MAKRILLTALTSFRPCHYHLGFLPLSSPENRLVFFPPDTEVSLSKSGRGQAQGTSHFTMDLLPGWSQVALRTTRKGLFITSAL